MSRRRLREFTAWYFRYYDAPNQDEMTDGGVQSKKIRAYDFKDAWDRWWKQNPAGDIYRNIYLITDDQGNEDFRD